jgi:hypothetical protein
MKTWKSLCDEVEKLGFENATPLARLVWSCEVGRGVNQHCAPDLQYIIERLNLLEAAWEEKKPTARRVTIFSNENE